MMGSQAMKRNILATFVSLAICGICMVAVVGCSSSSSSSGELSSDTGLTGGVAATVNGTDIEEDEITRSINNMRLSYGATDDETWRSYLQMMQSTPESLRYRLIESRVDQELVVQCADQLGITVTDEEVQSHLERTSSHYSSEEEWLNALEESGYESVDDYKDKLRYDILNARVTQHFEDEAEEYLADDANMLEALQEGIGDYDGAKRSSRILFSADDEDIAAQVKQEIVSGQLTFEQAFDEYNTDDSTKDTGGDMGWDKTNEALTADYTAALEGLETGVVSDPVANEQGVSLIMVTDVFDAPEKLTSESQIPEEILEQMKVTVQETESSDRHTEWLASLRAENDVTVNPMPENVPYNVDMSEVYSEEEIADINDKALKELEEGVIAEEEDTTEAEAEGDEASEESAEGDSSAAEESEADADADEEKAEGEADK